LKDDVEQPQVQQQLVGLQHTVETADADYIAAR
jgi:hypothetical protein